MTTLEKSSKLSACDTEVFEKILRNAPIGVLISDQEGKVCFANDSLNQIFAEENKQQLIGQNLCDLEWIKNSRLHNKLREWAENVQPFQNIPIGFENFENKELHLSFKAAPVKDEETIKGIICFVEDISEKVQLRKNLKEKSRELSIINEVSQALSTTMKTDEILEMILIGVTAGQGLGFNRAFLLLLNEKGDHLEGKMAIGTSDPKEAGRIWEELSKNRSTLRHVLQSYGKTAKQKDAEVRRIVENLKIAMEDDESILVRAVKERCSINSEQNLSSRSDRTLIELLGTKKFAVVPLVSKDKATGVIIADNFITSKPIKEEEIELLQIFASEASIAIENSGLYNRLTRQVKELEQANNALAQNTKRMIMIERFSTIGQITSRIAHQLRNPMTIIGGFAKSLLKKAKPNDPHHNSLEIIAAQIERMEKILNRLLDFTPKTGIEFKEADINLTIEQSLNMVESELAQEGIVLIKGMNRDLDSLQIDAEQLQVALMSIFRNSIQAMPSGGELRVATWLEDNKAMIEIKDTGMGIAENDLKNIFDPFYTTREDADGLGLTIASEIIRNHNGQIWAKSEKAEGTSIYIKLPTRRGEIQ